MGIIGFVIIGVVVIVLIPVFWWIGTSNGFKRKAIKIDEALSGVEVALTKRYDMLTKLLDVAKGYAKHERQLFTKVVEMRRGMSVGELSSAIGQTDALATRLFAVAEGYPELRSSENFKELQSGIRDAEEHLQAARRLYNSTTTAYNTAIVVFPSSIVANSMHLKKREFFAAEEAKRADVVMKF